MSKELEQAIELSDEEFMKLNHHSFEEEESENSPSSQEEDEVDETQTLPEEEESATIDTDETEVALEEENDETVEAPTNNEAEPEEAEIDYKAWYEKVNTPFKANGKNIEIKSPDELVALAQKGLNYTQKMQSIAPHRKLLLTLEQNGMLNEDQVNFLVDLNNKNPEAIKKFVKDSGIDPWDLSNVQEEEIDYTPNKHVISDSEAVLQDEIQTMLTVPFGVDTLNAIKDTWDAESKSMLAKEPTLLNQFREQKETGVYDMINDEISRLRGIGSPKIEGKSFLESYAIVGQSLIANDNTEPASQTTQSLAGNQNVQPPATSTNVRVGRTNSNGSINKARQAAPPRKAAEAGKPRAVNPLSLSDEEFLANANIYNTYLKD